MATSVFADQLKEGSTGPREIELPASSAWPLVLAVGFALLFAGLLTSASVSVLGAVLTLAGCVGWFREVFPHEHEEVVLVLAEGPSSATERRIVERLPIAPEFVRAWLPLETYPVSAGVKGGLAGSGKHLVSHQFTRRRGLCGIAETWTCTVEFVSRRQLRGGNSSARHRVRARGFAVWRDAAHVCTPTDLAGRPDRPSALVRSSVLDPWASQSSA